MTAAMASMRWRGRKWDYLIALHGRLVPSPADWNGYCALLESAPAPEEIRAITVTLRGAPNARQRAQHVEIHRRIGVLPDARACVVSDNSLIVGVMTAFAWTGFVHGLHAFPLRNLDGALEYVGVDPDEKPRLVADLLRLGDTVSDLNPVRAALDHVRRAS